MEKSPFDSKQNMNKKENKIEKSQIKEGIDFVFEQNPELAQIGTKEQYSKYLEYIFPESKVKDIVYHGTKTFNSLSKNGFSRDFSGKSNRGDKSGKFYFTNSIENADYSGVAERNIDQFAKKLEYVHEIFNTKNIPTVKELYKLADDLKSEAKTLQENINNLKKHINIFNKKEKGSQIINLESNIKELNSRVDFLSNEGAKLASNYHQGVNFLKGNKNGNSINPLNVIKNDVDNISNNSFTDYAKDITLNALYGTEDLKYSSKVVPVMLNIKNPVVRDLGYTDKDENPLLKGNLDGDFIDYNNKQSNFLKDFDSSDYDGAIQKNMFDILLSDVYIVKNPDQIHILGSDQDAEEFKKFMESQVELRS